MAQISHIPVSAIDPADTGFRISSPGGRDADLEASIRQVGLVVPLLVRPVQDTFILVSGFRRLAAITGLGWREVPCQVAGQVTNAELARIAVAENAFQRELSPAELIRAVCLLGRYMDTQAMADQSQALFNLNLNQGYIRSLEAIYALPAQVLDLLDAGCLSIKAAKAIAGCRPETARAFLDLFGAVRVSSGKQMEMITWLGEIAAREGRQVPDICRETDMQAILNPEKEAGHKDLAALGNRLRQYLAARRFPALEAAKAKAARAVNQLKLAKGTRIVLPENFESQAYTLCLTFTSPKELKARLKSLEALPDHPAFREVMDR